MTCCHITNIYLVLDFGLGQDEFFQIEVQLEDEVQERRLFPTSMYREPSELVDLIDPGSSERLPEEQQKRVRPLEYRLSRATNVHRFAALASAAGAFDRAKFRQKKFVRSVQDGPRLDVSSDDAFPGWDAAPSRPERIFSDWSQASAGCSGARFSEHWVLHLNAYRQPGSQAYQVGFVPAWTTKLKLQEVKVKASIYQLYGELQKLDGRVGLPFAWYFFMLHGNRVAAVVGEQVIAGAESGEIVIPEHDYRVLKRWQAYPYGF